MKRNMFKTIVCLIGFSTILVSCAQTGQYNLSSGGQQGAAVGGILGATAGTMLDSSNRWRGGVIGGVIGSILGGTLGEIANQANQQAAIQDKPVQYTNGNQTIRAVPEGKNTSGCKTITTYYYNNGELVKTKTEQVCPN